MRKRILHGLLLLGTLAIVAAPQTEKRAPEDQSWNRRAAGAGDYQIVLEVSGRIEIARHFEMADPLDLTAICEARKAAEARAFRSAEGYLSALEGASDARRRQIEIARLRIELGQLWSYRGDMQKTIESFEAARAALVRGGVDQPGYLDDLPWLDEMLGISHLRKGELDNCVHNHNAEDCIFPLSRNARHQLTAGSSAAIAHFKRHLARNPDNLEVRWLLNLAHMTLGRHPRALSPAELIPAPAATSRFPRFPDVAAAAGLDLIAGAGGAIMDDFDNDGLNDIVLSSVDACEPLAFFHNDGNGRFSNRTQQAGLRGQLGGINCVQTDFDNDGWLDIFVMRGGWEFPMRNSLLRNNRNGSFTDVTEAAGLLSSRHRTHSAAWADFDRDGLLDLYVGHEETPGQLFRNRGDGRFVDVTDSAGVGRTAFTKGVAWGDYDNDGFPDLYVSNYGSENFLFHNNGDGTFSEMGAKLGVSKPLMSFPTWFFDYDNDGRLDLFVASFVPSVTEIARHYLRLPPRAETMRLYRNTGQGFQDVTSDAGLSIVAPTMGANFGDLDNDGRLDLYLGTGAPSYTALMPNFVFHNLGRGSFADVTAASGMGHLQKGHGVAIGDLDNDGDQDVFVNVGGFVPGDKYNKALFLNPASNAAAAGKSHWLSIKLTGVKSNRAAIGARIKLSLTDAAGKPVTMYRTVGSGGSFGASPLAQHFGLGKGTPTGRIDQIEIDWPAGGPTQTLRALSIDQFIEITESVDAVQPRPRRPLFFRAPSPPAHHHPPAQKRKGRE
ncbi:MAG: CRTAC1 family protein [Blastocatellia bacterium]|nr:CRTAC1 family protein [Blastocatellia bacterium]